MTTNILRNRNVSSLLAGQAVSSLGDHMATVLLTALVYQHTGSAVSVAMMYLVSILPGILSIFIGPFLRYYPLRKIMINVEFLQMLIMASIPLVANYYFVLVYALIFVSTLLSVVFHSSRMSLLAEASGTSPVDKINSTDQVLQLISPIMGMVLGGVILSVSVQLVFLINAATFLFSGLCVWRVTVGNVPVESRNSSEIKLIKDFLYGFHYIRKNMVLLFNVYGNFLINFGVGAYNAMIIVYVYSHLHMATTGYTILMIAEYIGLSLSGIWFSFFLKQYRKGRWLVIGNILMGLLVIGLAASQSIAVSSAIVFLVGALNLVTNTISRTMLMESVDFSMRSTVINVRFALGRPVCTIGAMIGGFLTEWSGNVSVAIIISGTAILMNGVLAAFLPPVMNYDETNATQQTPGNEVA